jgi:DnaJ like chaperone protein
MFFIFAFAMIGLWVGGATGFFIGAALGLGLRHFAEAALRRRLAEVHSRFVDTTFAVMGALCKADGVVTPDEIQVAEEGFLRLQLSPDQKQAARVAFKRGKAPDFDLDATVAEFAQTAHPGSMLFQLFLQLQLQAVAADGEIHPAEHTMLLRVARGLGFPEHALARFEALLRAAASGIDSSRVPSRQRLEDAYAALGVSPEAGENEIKRAYRKMITEYHPDKLASKGVPASMRQLAEERSREINVAYDLIKKARQFA